MSEVIPFRKPSSKPKEDEEMAAFLKLLDLIQKISDEKAGRENRGAYSPSDHLAGSGLHDGSGDRGDS